MGGEWLRSAAASQLLASVSERKLVFVANHTALDS
jgi:hypothetical protein